MAVRIDPEQAQTLVDAIDIWKAHWVHTIDYLYARLARIDASLPEDIRADPSKVIHDQYTAQKVNDLMVKRAATLLKIDELCRACGSQEHLQIVNRQRVQLEAQLMDQKQTHPQQQAQKSHDSKH